MNSKTITYNHKVQSIQSKVVRFFFRLIDIKGKLKNARFSSKMQKASVPVPPKRYLKHSTLITEQVAGRNVFVLRPVNGKSKKHILFFHGGAYVLNFTLVHWKFISKLVKETNYTVVAPDYPLLPDYSYKERLAMAEEVYKDLLKITTANHIIIMGDSAGGNLALSLAQKLVIDKIEQPSQIILLSPWLDVTMSNPEMEEINKRDPILPLGDNTVGKLHAGDRDMKDFLVSPLYGSVKGLGKISLFTGTDEILYPDALKFKKNAAAEGIEINYFEYEHMFHDWILFPIPEAKIAFKQVVGLITTV